MSDGKIDPMENICSQSLAANGDKEDEALNNSVSDGEIVDDDDPEEQKSTIINFSHRKVSKNFRSRHKNESDDEADGDKKKGITDIDLKKLKARIDNGDQMLDNSTLESFRRKIIEELGPKDDKKLNNEFRNTDQHRNRQRPFDTINRRRNDDRDRRHNNVRGRGNRMSFHERNRIINRNREQNFNRNAGPDEFKVFGESRALFFPKSIIKYTKSTPSVSYSENPSARRSHKNNVKEDEKEKDKKEPERKQKSEKPSVKESKKVEQSKEIVEKVPFNESPIKKDLTTAQPKAESSDIKEELKVEESPSVIKLEKFKLWIDPESLVEKSPEKINNCVVKPKVEMKIERKKSPRRIEKPKVNIFLEDSDEVDEFESVVIERKSKWSSPILSKEEDRSLKLVPTPNVEIKRKLVDIPVVIESPEKSPITPAPLTENIFESSSIKVEKSLTPSPPPQKTLAKPVRNVCSFLSDIASGSMFSGLGHGMFNDDDDDNEQSSFGLNLDDYKIDMEVALPDSRKIDETDYNMEPDTTAGKDVDIQKLLPSPNLVKNDSSDSDDSDSDTSSSSDSDSDDTTSESEESSEESSDEEVPSFTRGFGRFDASSMPMVTQIKPATVPGITPVAVSTIASRFQAQQRIIKPPELATNIIKPPIYGVSALPTIPTPFNIGGPMGFQIPFKIYSLRDQPSCEMIYPTPVVQPPVLSIPTPTNDRSDKRSNASDKDKREKDRKRSRSRSHSRERDKKRATERRKTPPRRRSPSPIKKRHSDDRKQIDTRRREPSPRHSSHSSRVSHASRHSPIRRQRKSRSRSPQNRIRSPVRTRSPPRPRTPPSKIRRSPPPRRSSSRSPAAKHRRSSSPSIRRGRSPSPGFRRSPRRRSPLASNRNRRTPSPDYRYDRRSFSPTFRKNMDSPIGYKPDSTISDTELERQQYMQEEFYLAQWNAPQTNSPKRPNLDDRIHRMLSDSPTHVPNANAPNMYQQPDGYPYQMQQDMHGGMFYPDMYQQNHHHMPPPPHLQLQTSRFNQQPMNHLGQYEEFNNFSSPRTNYVNNSNLVEITQQKRDRQRVPNSQAVQVGNVLEIVPSKIATSPDLQTFEKPKQISPQAVQQQSEKRSQVKLKRKADRERKRVAKHARKEKLRQEIQRYIEAGINAEHSDDESLVNLRPVNIFGMADRSIIKKVKETETETKDRKRVLFKDGIHPGETSSEGPTELDNEMASKTRSKRLRKRRVEIKKRTLNGKILAAEIKIDPELDKAPAPAPPQDGPPIHLKQPRLKKITVEMFAAFPVNPEPIYYYIQRMQQANGYHQSVPPPRPNDRFHYYKKQPPPNVGQSPGYLQQQQQQRSAISKPPNSVSSLDPRMQRAEKTFA